MKSLFVALAAVSALAVGGAAHAQSPQQPMITNFPITKLTAGMYVITVEVARDERAREQGLMYRKSLALNSGMLFDYRIPVEKTCMWMKNTDIPLSVAFMDEEGVIINIEDMQPHTEDNHCGLEGKKVRYALEMDQGWFAQKHIGAGDKIGRADGQSVK